MATLSVGGIILIMSVCGTPSAILGVRHMKRKRRKRLEAYRVEKSARLTKASFENQVIELRGEHEAC